MKLLRVAAWAVGIVACNIIAFALSGVLSRTPSGDPLSTGKYISPVGDQTNVGSYPANMALSPNGQYLVVSNIGFRQYLTVLRTADGVQTDQVDLNGDSKIGKGKAGLYYGLAFGENGRGAPRLYVSRGAEDAIGVYEIGADGRLIEAGEPIRIPEPSDKAFPSHVAGLAINQGQRFLCAALNQTHQGNDFQGALSVIDTTTGREVKRVAVGGYPYGVACAGTNAYVGCERDSDVYAIDLIHGKVIRKIRTGLAPVGLAVSRDQSRLFVANSGSDTVSMVDTKSNKVLRTVLLRPALLNLPGASPVGLTLSPDESKLFVALADMNAVAVLELPEMNLLGHIPAGWYPTSLAASPNGQRLFVANAKGVNPRNANGKPVGEWGQYIQMIIEGTVATIDLNKLPPLEQGTQAVLENNRIRAGLNSSRHSEFRNPGIEHVIYIVKENRTYDQVLGDIQKGNGDPSLTLFGREVTPNLHSLAERFVLMDNFFVCAEVSADGWNWSTSSMANPYVSRNTVYNYSDRGRSYDFEGSNSNAPVDLLGKNDVARSPGGYLWDNALKHHVSLRNYGMFMIFKDPKEKRFTAGSQFGEQIPNKKALQKVTDPNFRRYDLAYADSEAWVRHGVSAPVQLKEYGAYKAPSRFSAWKREFDEFVRKGKMPRFSLMRFGNDHTWGTAAGRFSPKALVADNDYAVGQVVDAVSHSPFWKNTAIFVIEDDAQAGQDHVDAHRSTAYVISPFVKRGLVHSTFGNTAGLIRTMELLLGIPPMNQYDAVASPLDVFSSTASNLEPYSAVLPPKEIVCEINQSAAYRSADSLRLINRYQEESMPDIELNDILWTSIRGKVKPASAAPRLKDKDD